MLNRFNQMARYVLEIVNLTDIRRMFSIQKLEHKTGVKKYANLRFRGKKSCRKIECDITLLTVLILLPLKHSSSVLTRL